jgi:RHS repeat-associated protein
LRRLYKSMLNIFLIASLLFSSLPLADNTSYAESINTRDKEKQVLNETRKDKLSEQYAILDEEIQDYLDQGYAIEDIEKALKTQDIKDKDLGGVLEKLSPEAINNSKTTNSKFTSNLSSSNYTISVSSQNEIPDYSYVNTKPDEAPFAINAGQEIISTLSGGLSQSVVDTSLTGRNGLGFSLIRKYDSGSSQFNMMVGTSIGNGTAQATEEKLFPIGKGWSWDVSYVEVAGSDKYLHIAGSGVFKIGLNNVLVGYPWKDLTFSPDTTVTVSGVQSTFSLKSTQKVSQYFNAKGQLIQISDSYNNKITFVYTVDLTYGSVLSSITDAIGNEINITYSSSSVVVTKGSQIVTYNKTTKNGKELLSQVVDPLGRVTTYDYNLQDALFNLYGTTPTNTNPYALLTGVTYPTGAKSIYAYESIPVTRYIGENAVNQVFRAKSREDQYTRADNSIEVFNHKDITYPTGDIGSSHNADITFTVALLAGQIQTTFTNEKDFIDSYEPLVFYNTKVSSTSTYSNHTYTTTTDYTYDRARNWPVPIIIKETKTSPESAGIFVQETNKTYDDYGNVTSSTDPMGTKTIYSFDPSSHLLVASLFPLSSSQFQYTEYVRDLTHGSVTAVRVRDGNESGNILKETINSGYDIYGNITQVKILVSPGVYTTIDTIYDTSPPYNGGFPTQTTILVHNVDDIVSAIVRKYSYNTSNGTISSFLDGNGNTTQYEYDTLGRVTKAIHPDSNFKSIQYNDNTNEIQYTDETGVRNIEKWNPIGMRIEEGIIDNRVYKSKVKYRYNGKGQLIEVEDALGNVTQYGYDQWSRQNLITFPDLTTATISYDDLNNTQTSTDAEGYQIKEYYDKLGRKLTNEETKKINGGTATQTNTLATYTYDNAGHVLIAKDNVTPQNTTSYAYDTLGQLTSVTNAKMESTSYQFDLLGDLTQITFPDGNMSQKKYDQIGRLIQTTDANSKIEKFYYDANGNQTRLLDRNGNRFKYTFGNRNLLQKKEVVDSSWNPITGEEAISFSYDVAGRRTQMVDTTGITNYSFSTNTGALTTVTFPDLKTIKYDYDASGNRSAMNDPFGLNTFYHYDSKSRLDTVAPSPDFTSDYDVKYQYYNDNLLKQSKQGNGVTSDYSYDGIQLNSLTQKKSDGSTLNAFSYTYDINGNQLTKTENGTISSFGYDTLNRISTSTQFNETYNYDSRGNRTSMTSNSPFESPGKEYVYDKRDRLTTVTTTEGKIVSYKYNGDGLLWERTENGQTTRYYWDGDQVIAEASITDGISTLKARYIRGQGLIAREDEQGKAYYLQNGHGDVVELRDSTGNTRLNQYSYDIFGNITSQSEIVSQPFKYSGEMTDNTTSLQYLRSRWYDPSMGRFINEDTYEGQIDNPLSMNLYTYAHNNPLIYIDPTGHSIGAAWGKVIGNFKKQAEDAVVTMGKHAYNAFTGGLASDIYESAVGVDFFTGQKLSATQRVISGASAALFFSPALEGFTLTSKSAKALRVLNIGSGTNPIKGAINIDLKAIDGVDLVADATKKLPYANNSVDSIISINPFNFNPINSATTGVLKEGGTFTIVGQVRNSYFNNIYAASSEEISKMGYEMVSRGIASDTFKLGTKTTTGHAIDPGSLFQIILKKK